MSRKNKIILILAIIVLIFILVFWKLNREKDQTVVVPEQKDVVTVLPEALPPTTSSAIEQKIATADVEEQQQINNLIKLAAAFTERFGSYSNQSSFQNIRDLQIFMTDSMKKWSENYIDSFTGKDNSIYYGVTTKALNSQIIEYNEGVSAEILVKTQRREAMGNTVNATISYQDILVEMKRENGDIWKVNGAFWQ